MTKEEKTLREGFMVAAEQLLVSYQSRVDGKISADDFRKEVYAFPDRILALISSAPKDSSIPKPPLTGAERITAERERQMSEEGWTAEHDDHQLDYDLASVGALYALNLLFTKHENYSMFFDKIFAYFYPWDNMYWKPTPNNPIKQLTKAGALIAAEIDRLQRIREDNNDRQ